MEKFTTSTTASETTEITNPSNYMAGLSELLKRQDDELNAQKQGAVSFDKEKNFVYAVQGKIALEATEDKIVILLDKFKTGFECSECAGTGVLQQCSCRTGTNRFGSTCTKCNGEPMSFAGKDCPICKGRGTSIIIPESSKSLPTSGIIVSAGPQCTKREVGERILFGAHTGYYLPFKGNVRLRIMREHEPLCLIHMLDNGDEVLGDFIYHEEPIDNR